MSGLPAYFPIPKYVPSLPRRGTIPLRDVCEQAGIYCRAFGRWTERPILMVAADDAHPGGQVLAEPHKRAVQVFVPGFFCDSPVRMARYTLGVLAYALFDRVARESIRGCHVDWAYTDLDATRKCLLPVKPLHALKEPNMEKPEFEQLLSICHDIANNYEDTYFIGGIAMYLHAMTDSATRGLAEMTHDADFCISTLDLDSMRQIESVTKNQRLSKSELCKHGFEFDIYPQWVATLIVPYDAISAHAEMVDGIKVACLEHLAALKLVAYADRRESDAGEKDARDLVRIALLAENKEFRPELATPYLDDKRMQLLESLKMGSAIMDMANGNAKTAKRIRQAVESLVNAIQVQADEDGDDAGDDAPSP